jgi:hypothetical protein
MKDLAKMRLDILKEIKHIKIFFEKMEEGVKSRDPNKIYPAYVFLSNLVYHMNEGDLTPLSVELKQELLHSEYNKNSLS